MEKTTENVSKVGIVGGGHVGEQLLKMFSKSSLTQVSYVVDLNPQAPAMVTAKAAGVPTFTDLGQALSSQRVDYVVEITGSAKVLQAVRDKLPENAELISHGVAYIIIKGMEENRNAAYKKVFGDVSTIKDEITSSLNSINTFIEKIDKITDDLQLLALNARIEAARAGEHGKGFSIVAQQVEKSADFAKKMAKEIDRVNSNIHSISERLESSLSQLR